MSKNHYSFPWGIYLGDTFIDNDSIPILIDSSKKGFCLTFDDNSEYRANELIENIALSSINVLPLGMIDVKAFDFGKNRFLNLSSLKEIGIYEVANTIQKAKNLFDDIEDIAKYRHYELLSSDIQNISDYNLQQESKEKYYLLLINLERFTQDIVSLSRVKDFFNLAFEAGIFTIFFGNINELIDDKVTNYIVEKFPILEIKENKFIFNKDIFEFYDILDNFDPLEQNRKTLTKKILDNYKEKDSNTLEKNFLHIPIGQAGRETVYLDMGLKSGLYNAFIAGTKGSGKSFLLHNILVEIAKNYTAKEIELNIIDFSANGLELAIYKNHPNCRKLFLGVSNPNKVLEMFQNFEDEMQKRADIMLQSGVSLIDRYNNKNPNNPLPYKILIIDEFQDIFEREEEEWKNNRNKFNAYFIKIAKQGRKFGLHFIFVSQSDKVKNIDKSILGQIDITISFRLKKQLEAMHMFDEKEAYSKVSKLKVGEFVIKAQDIKLAELNKINGKSIKQKDVSTNIESILSKMIEDIRAKRAKDEVLTPIVIKDSNEPNRTNNTQEQPKREAYKPKYSTDREKEILEEFKRKIGGGE